jgi:hypothetical protein
MTVIVWKTSKLFYFVEVISEVFCSPYNLRGTYSVVHLEEAHNYTSCNNLMMKNKLCNI